MRNLVCAVLDSEVLLEQRGNSFVAMIGYYLNTVLEGPPHPSPAGVAIADLSVVRAAYWSVETGREVKLSEVDG